MRADLLVTAGGGDDDLGFCGDSFVQGIVGRGVAGVQCDQDVGTCRVETADRALDEIQAVETACPGLLTKSFRGRPAPFFHGRVLSTAAL